MFDSVWISHARSRRSNWRFLSDSGLRVYFFSLTQCSVSLHLREVTKLVGKALRSLLWILDTRLAAYQTNCGCFLFPNVFRISQPNPGELYMSLSTGFGSWQFFRIWAVAWKYKFWTCLNAFAALDSWNQTYPHLQKVWNVLLSPLWSLDTWDFFRLLGFEKDRNRCKHLKIAFTYAFTVFERDMTVQNSCSHEMLQDCSPFGASNSDFAQTTSAIRWVDKSCAEQSTIREPAQTVLRWQFSDNLELKRQASHNVTDVPLWPHFHAGRSPMTTWLISKADEGTSLRDFHYLRLPRPVL